jgi:hypothetical protein
MTEHREKAVRMARPLRIEIPGAHYLRYLGRHTITFGPAMGTGRRSLQLLPLSSQAKAA